ncbi:putative Inositol-pentakisphosphate 2-kinase [Paratrimastix pyriformis]|uniref:Inositol-pentakisphosphate 2-kinase n=1 Tax=Paratrimastix pyriformis TaxID=342808 RepID=A0ABQ8UH59_9EUKA|nr:putative Inositol-pentakisphosphate 2-kinase [Paratrimastix pyriformis]
MLELLEVDMTASVWHYKAEGGSSIVLSYAGTTENLRGKVLRISKSSLVGHPIAKRTTNDLLFASHFQHLIPSGSAPVLVNVTPSFLARIASSIEPVRPACRRESAAIDLHNPCAVLLEDSTVLPGPENIPAIHRTIGIEIKPKIGFPEFRCPTGPLCRYSLMQALKLGAGVPDAHVRSSYCPVAFFSADRARRLRSLRALFECPQNNFRLFVDGCLHSLPSHGSARALDSFELALRSLGWTVEEALVATCDLLHDSGVLVNLAAIQQLDQVGIYRISILYESIILTLNQFLRPGGSPETLNLLLRAVNCREVPKASLALLLDELFEPDLTARTALSYLTAQHAEAHVRETSCCCGELQICLEQLARSGRIPKSLDGLSGFGANLVDERPKSAPSPMFRFFWGEAPGEPQVLVNHNLDNGALKDWCTAVNEVRCFLCSDTAKDCSLLIAIGARLPAGSAAGRVRVIDLDAKHHSRIPRWKRLEDRLLEAVTTLEESSLTASS